MKARVSKQVMNFSQILFENLRSVNESMLFGLRSSFDYHRRMRILNEHFCGNSQETITRLNEANWNHSRSWWASRCRLVRRTRGYGYAVNCVSPSLLRVNERPSRIGLVIKLIGTFLIRARRASIRHDTFPVATIRSSPRSPNWFLVSTLLCSIDSPTILYLESLERFDTILSELYNCTFRLSKINKFVTN